MVDKKTGCTANNLTKIIERLKREKNLQNMRLALKSFDRCHVDYCRKLIAKTEQICCVHKCSCNLYITLFAAGTYEEAERFAGLCNYTLNLIP